MGDFPKPIRSTAFVNVKKFRAVGDGITDATTALQRALDNEQYVTFGYGPAPLTFKTSAPLVLSDGHVIDGVGATFKPTGSSSFSVFSLAGTVSSHQNLDADAAERDMTITLVTGGVAALGLVVGDYIWVNTTAGAQRHQINRVKAIAGEDVDLVEPLYWDFNTVDTARVAKLSPKTADLRNLKVDGSDNTGANTSAVRLQYTLDATVEKLRAVNMLGAGVWADTDYGLNLLGLKTLKCGNGSLATHNVSIETRMTVANVDDLQSAGFGPCFFHCTKGIIRGLMCSDPTERAFKLQTSAYNVLSDFHISNVPGAYGGIALVIGSSHNLLANAIVVNGGGYGLWIDGSYNQCRGLKILNSGNEVTIPDATSIKNYVEGEFETVADSGVDNHIVHV